eukprot:44667_1
MSANNNNPPPGLGGTWCNGDEVNGSMSTQGIGSLIGGAIMKGYNNFNKNQMAKYTDMTQCIKCGKYYYKYKKKHPKCEGNINCPACGEKVPHYTLKLGYHKCNK